MENILTITQLNDFIFCPRSLYYNGIYRNNTDTSIYHSKPQTTGLASHNSIDNATYSSRKDVLMGTMVYCEKYNLLGRIDIFDISSGILTERKHSITAIYDGFKYQLYAQYFALTEMGYCVKKLQLYSQKDNKIYSVPLPSSDDEQRIEQLLINMRNWKLESIPIINPNKCKNCIYSSLCDVANSE